MLGFSRLRQRTIPLTESQGYKRRVDKTAHSHICRLETWPPILELPSGRWNDTDREEAKEEILHFYDCSRIQQPNLRDIRQASTCWPVSAFQSLKLTSEQRRNNLSVLICRCQTVIVARELAYTRP
jgi:hypothetical protein